MITVHNIGPVGTNGSETLYDVDMEWPGARDRYRFIYDGRDPIAVAFSPPAERGGLPLAFYRENNWAHPQLCGLVWRVHRGEPLSFPIELRDAA